MEMPPSLSIIIPAYNCARFLPQTIESVLSQSSPDWEVLLVDDGSDDGVTPALCDSYAGHEKIRVFHKPNGGLSDARNHGIDRADGKYIAFLDADDLLHPDFVRLTLDAARDSHADIIYTAIDFYTGDFKIRPVAPDLKIEIRPPAGVLEAVLLQTKYDNGAWGKIYSRKIWETLRFRKGTWYEDLDVCYRYLSLARSVAYIPHKLYGYRQNPSGFIRTFSLGHVDSLDVTDRMLSWLSANAPLLFPGMHGRIIRAAADRRMSAHFHLLLLLFKARGRVARLVREGKVSRTGISAVRTRCRKVIRGQRWASFTNRRVRLKNRLGAALSYLFIGF